MKPWHRRWEMPHPWEPFQARLDEDLSNLIQLRRCPCSLQGVELDGLQRSLPTQTIL